MKINKFATLAVAAAVMAFGFIACDNNDVINIGESATQNAPKNILRFDSPESLLMEIESSLKRASLPAEIRLRQGNTSDEFVSFGELADRAYERVALLQDEFKSIEEVKAAIAVYSDFLQLVYFGNGEYAVKTKLYRSPTRYIINERRMYQIEETLVKTLEEATIFTCVENYKLLARITDTDIANARRTENLRDSMGLISINDNIYTVDFKDGIVTIFSPPVVPPPTVGRPSSHLGREQSKTLRARCSNGRDNRLKVHVYIITVWITGPTIIEWVALDIQSHRRGALGAFWWTKQRDITHDINVKIWFPNTFAYVHDRTFIRPERAWRIHRAIGGFSHAPSTHRAVLVGTRGFACSGIVYVPFNFGNF